MRSTDRGSVACDTTSTEVLICETGFALSQPYLTRPAQRPLPVSAPCFRSGPFPGVRSAATSGPSNALVGVNFLNSHQEKP